MVGSIEVIDAEGNVIDYGKDNEVWELSSSSSHANIDEGLLVPCMRTISSLQVRSTRWVVVIEKEVEKAIPSVSVQ